MTVYERALDFVRDGAAVGLGSGRASTEFIKMLGAKVRAGLRVRGVPTSQASADLAVSLGIPLVSLEEAMPLDVAVDGADECDPNLDLIKGYGRALVREKIVAAAAKTFIVLFGNKPPGDVKNVPVLGTKGKLPVEVVPFAVPLAQRKLRDLGCDPILWMKDGKTGVTDNGNNILDCGIKPIADAAGFHARIRAIPGVVDTGLFVGMANVVLSGDENFNLVSEKTRKQ
jgi:ribose 5-phosphate isomerase A